MEGSNAWIVKKVEELHASNPEKTVCVVAEQSEIKSGGLDDLLPAGLSACKDWRQDLSLDGSVWFYKNKRVLLVQLAKVADDAKDEVVRKSFRKLGVTACKALQGKKITDVEFLVTSKVAGMKKMGDFENQFYLANFDNNMKWKGDEADEDANKDEDYDPRTKRVDKKVDNYTITCEDESVMKTEEAEFQRAAMSATEIARRLCSTRGSVANPAFMEEQIRNLVKDHPSVKELRVLQMDQLQEQGMNLFYNVGKGADVKPRCVMVHYVGDPSRPDEVDIAFVGKGVTYDTGGLNIKPTGQMEDMYGDKGGSCAVIGALKGTLQLGLKKNVVFSCGFADNAIGADCYKPGDILTSMKGLTVEIGNTDAEGRLVMADTMTYVQRNFKPKQLVDIATLTGACLVALGNYTGGLFTNDDNITDEFKAASKASFEPMWHMPILDDHKEAIIPAIADIKNIGKNPFGGACTAASFLLRFVEKDVKWAHLDVAGPCLATRGGGGPGCTDMTGFGASLLLHFIKGGN